MGEQRNMYITALLGEYKPYAYHTFVTPVRFLSRCRSSLKLAPVALVLYTASNPGRPGFEAIHCISMMIKHDMGEAPSQQRMFLSRIFGSGGKMLNVIVDGGCTHSPQFSRGDWGHAPPEFF